MKATRFLLIPFLTICLVLASCSGTSQQTVAPADNTGSTDAPTTEETTAEASPETAMENFFKKVDEANYVIDAKEHLKTSVCSEDLVCFEYADEVYNDYVVMSVDNEVFQAFLTDEEDDGLFDLTFIAEGKAVDAAEPRLLSYWMDEDVSEGNIWNLFYNTEDDPLTFVSYEDTVKESMMHFAGYGDSALRLMHEVYLVLDAEDPTEAHLTAEMDDDVVARIFYDDIDIAVTFGNAEGNEAAENWMKDPVYPGARMEWTDGDLFVFNSVFLPGFGETAVPFPIFASYALTVDDKNFVDTDEVYIRDPHATEEDLESYANLLKTVGFNEVEQDGKTYYRKLLRPEYDCYASIELEYDSGLNITAKKYYDFPAYDGLAAVNEVIMQHGYPQLEDSPVLTSVKAEDRANEMTESWLYFFDYDLGLYVSVEYTDYDAVMEYLDSYAAKLTEAGFSPVYADEGEIDHYDSENHYYSFRYHFDEDDALTLLFKSERYITADAANAAISEAGFPAINFTEPVACRDLRKYAKVSYSADYKLYLTVSKEFDSVEEAEKFFNDYEAALTEAGFGRVNPENAGVRKEIAIVNEDYSMIVGIDFFEEGEGASIYYEFRAE